MKKIMTVLMRMIPMLVVMTVIFLLSHQTGDDDSFTLLPGMDKLAHMAAYAVLAASTLFAFGKQKNVHPQKAIVLTVVFCLLYGLSDEFHQSFIPGRTVSVYDLLADGVGSALTCLLWQKARKGKTIFSL